MRTDRTPKVVSRVLERYGREFDFYDQAASACRELCQKLLAEAGVRAMMTSRAKSPASLRKKLISRHRKKPYTRTASVYADIVDLAGVRIALYFPGDRAEVRRILEANFVQLQPPKEFPDSGVQSYPGGFRKHGPGYLATHFRVSMPAADLSADKVRFAEAHIEIQVASVLMHAWAEVEHDLVYKPTAGRLSEAEYRILDGLNNLVVSGEGSLESLQGALRERVSQEDRSFENHYELAVFLHQRARQLLGAGDELPMGRADVLLRFLREADLQSASKIEGVLEHLQLSDGRPLVEQLVDAILVQHPDLYEVYDAARRRESANPYSASDESKMPPSRGVGLQRFMARWIALERGAFKAMRLGGDRHPTPVVSLEAFANLSKRQREKMDSLRRLRNQVVHGIELPDSRYLETAALELDELIDQLAEALGGEAADLMYSTRDRLDPDTQ